MLQDKEQKHSFRFYLASNPCPGRAEMIAFISSDQELYQNSMDVVNHLVKTMTFVNLSPELAKTATPAAITVTAPTPPIPIPSVAPVPGSAPCMVTVPEPDTAPRPASATIPNLLSPTTLFPDSPEASDLAAALSFADTEPAALTSSLAFTGSATHLQALSAALEFEEDSPPRTMSTALTFPETSKPQPLSAALPYPPIATQTTVPAVPRAFPETPPRITSALQQQQPQPMSSALPYPDWVTPSVSIPPSVVAGSFGAAPSSSIMANQTLAGLYVFQKLIHEVNQSNMVESKFIREHFFFTHDGHVFYGLPNGGLLSNFNAILAGGADLLKRCGVYRMAGGQIIMNFPSMPGFEIGQPKPCEVTSNSITFGGRQYQKVTPAPPNLALNGTFAAQDLTNERMVSFGPDGSFARRGNLGSLSISQSVDQVTVSGVPVTMDGNGVGRYRIYDYTLELLHNSGLKEVFTFFRWPLEDDQVLCIDEVLYIQRPTVPSL
eukprot:jgi/Chlat1/3192/Chrsp22S08801